MIDLIKKTLLAGVGAAVITKDRVEAALGEFVDQGKVSAREAREMADKISEQGRREFESISHELSDKVRDRFTSADRKTNNRIDALEARIAVLEQRAGVSSVITEPVGRTDSEVGA